VAFPERNATKEKAAQAPSSRIKGGEDKKRILLPLECVNAAPIRRRKLEFQFFLRSILRVKYGNAVG